MAHNNMRRMPSDLSGDWREREKQLAATVIPQWFKAAPRAAAKAYVLRIRAIMPGTPVFAAELLFGTALTRLSVQISGSLGGFTIGQLKFPKGTVTIEERRNSNGKTLDTSPTSKLSAGETMLLCGRPHHLATVAVMQNKVLVLLKPKDAEAIRAELKDERASLMLAAQDLYGRLLPCD